MIPTQDQIEEKGYQPFNASKHTSEISLKVGKQTLQELKVLHNTLPLVNVKALEVHDKDNLGRVAAGERVEGGHLKDQAGCREFCWKAYVPHWQCHARYRRCPPCLHESDGHVELVYRGITHGESIPGVSSMRHASRRCRWETSTAV